MNPILTKLLVSVLTSKALGRLIVGIVFALVRRTDNSIDDEFAVALAEALDIRIELDTKPKDGNIFVENEKLDQIKSNRTNRPGP